MDENLNRPHRIVENGEGKEFRLYAPVQDTEDETWWSETCALVSALSEGDLETFRRAISLEEDGDSVELITALGSVTNELYSRLECLGYTLPGDTNLPDNFRHVCVKHTFLNGSSKAAAAFVDAQLMQMKRLGENREPLNEFAQKFSGLTDLHLKLSLDMLGQLRNQFSNTRHRTQVEPQSDLDVLYSDYARRGIVKSLGPGQWKTTLPGALNAPFLLDLVRHRRTKHAATRH